MTRDEWGLTPAERRVAELVGAGDSIGEIADALFISKRTVKFHMANLRTKFQVDQHWRLVAFCGCLGCPHRPSGAAIGAKK